MRGGREKFYYTFVANSATLVVSVYQRITADTSPDKTTVSIIGISFEGGGGGGILAALPRNNYDRVARRLIAFNVQPSKLPRNR